MIARPMVRIAALRPIHVVRSSPSKWSPMRTTPRLMSPAEPTPRRNRVATSMAKFAATAVSTPARPNTMRQRVRIGRRPQRSAAKPMIGARKMPGSDAAATRGPAEPADWSNVSRMSGSNGETRLFAIMPVRVTAKTRGRTRWPEDRCTGAHHRVWDMALPD